MSMRKIRRQNSPLRPLLACPVSSVTEPELPMLALPVLKAISPLLPWIPASDV